MADKTVRTVSANRAGRHAAVRNSSGNKAKRSSGSRRTPSGKGRPKARKKKKSGLSVLGKVALVLCVLLLLVVLAAIAIVYSKISKLDFDFTQLDPDKLSISDELQYDETGYLNVALFGLDTRENDEEMGSRSDTIIIASLNRETKEVKMSSVYRDTLMQMDDKTYNKANAAYSFGQEQEALAMLNRNLDMDIMHYVTVDFSALVDVIDALGGIDIEVTEEEIPYLNNYSVEIIENTGVDTWGITEPGYQHLTGVQATAYARIRYGGGDDFRRTERQREVLSKIAEKAQTASLGALNTIIDRVFPKIRTNFTLPEILAYAKDVKKYQLGESCGFPYEVDTMDYGEAGNVVVPLNLKANVKKLHTFFFGEDGYLPSSTVSDISDEIIYLSGMGAEYGSDDGSDYYGNGDGSTYGNDGSSGYGASGGSEYDENGNYIGSGSGYNGTGGDGSGGYTDPNGGYGDGSGGYTDPNGGYGDGSGGYTDPNGGYGDTSGGYTDPGGGYGDGSGSDYGGTGTGESY